MDPSNKPKERVVAEGQPELPPPTYLSLANWIGHHPMSVGRALVQQYGHVGWEEALEVTDKVARQVAAGENQIRQMMGSYADSLGPVYLLVMDGGKVTVVYGFRVCRALSEAGSRYAGLLGDRRPNRGGVGVPLALVVPASMVGDQATAFSQVTVKSPTLEALTDALEGDETVEMVEALPEANAEPAIEVWKALPIHGKMAALFVGGMTPRKAIKVFEKVTEVVPEAHHGKLNGLGCFLRAAVTGTGHSVISHAWVKQNPFGDENLV